MTERERISFKAQAFFEDLWKRGDPWEFETSEFERDKYARQLAMLQGRRYGRVLEIGCGAGSFSRDLARIADQVVAVDISAAAIARAKTAETARGVVDYRVVDIMNYDLNKEGPWDLVVMSETICYLGWLHSFFEVGWLATELFAATCSGGRFLMANTQSGVDDDEYLLRPWLIRTYRDLFLNVGYRLDVEEIFRSQKHGVGLEVLISLYYKTHAAAPESGS
jgi:SAM-dependent methyltransferase